MDLNKKIENDLKIQNKYNNFKYYIPIIITIVVLILAGISVFISYINKQPKNATPPVTNLNTLPVSPQNEGPVPGQILVKFKIGVHDSEINAHLKPLHVKVLGKINGINVTILEVPNGQEENIRNVLIKDPIVQYAERNYYAHTTMNPNDTDFTKEWGLLNTGSPVADPKTNQSITGTANADIHVVKAWDVTKGTGIKVGVVDTGIDMTHPDLTGKIADNVVYETTTIDDGFGHGTHVAGVVAASTNNSQGIAGVCPDCQLYIAKCLNDSGSGDLATIAKGITWAADKGVKVINISAGGSNIPQTLTDAVKYAQGKGILLVAGAGNNGNSNKFYPAAIDGVIGVAATDNNDKKSNFSTYGNWVQIAAPGFAIYSTIPHEHDSNLKQGYPNLGRTYGSLSGTSMASPFVSGVAALVFSTQYGTSADAVKQRLCDTADKVDGTGSYWVCGRVNAEAAVGTPPSPTTSNQPSNSPIPTQQQSPQPSIQPSESVTVPPTGTIIPTFVCGGSGVGDVCPPTNSPNNSGNGENISPTSTQNDNTNPTNSSGQQPNNPGNSNNGSNPANNPTGSLNSNQPIKPNSGNNGLINILLDLIRKLLNLIMKLFKWW